MSSPRGDRVGDIQLRGGALRHTNRSAIQLFDGGNAQFDARADTLTIIERGRAKSGAPNDFTAQRPGGIARHHVDLATLHRRLPLSRRQRPEGNGVGIAQHRRSDSLADIYVKALEFTSVIDDTEANELSVDATNQLTASQHILGHRPQCHIVLRGN